VAGIEQELKDKQKKLIAREKTLKKRAHLKMKRENDKILREIIDSMVDKEIVFNAYDFYFLSANHKDM
jgi:hypothetical protein